MTAPGWSKWFAWYPVRTVDIGWTWLEPVHYRCIVKYNYPSRGGRTIWFQYAKRPMKF